MEGHFRGVGLNRYMAQLQSERALGRVRADCRDQTQTRKLQMKQVKKLRKQNESMLQAELQRLQKENAKLQAEVVIGVETAPKPASPEEQLRARFEAEKLSKMAQSVKGRCRLDHLASVGNGL